MPTTEISDAVWARLSAFIAETIGLHFPRERWADLQRGITAAAEAAGARDVLAWAEALMVEAPDRAQRELLARHLTIGETYFFRDTPAFDALTGRILPELIQTRRSHGRRLRLWSAACCTGEEPYSLAMLLHELLPDLADWHVTLLATDINPEFLRKAAAGVYGEWSFRSAPAWVQERYCTRTPDRRWAVRPEVRRLVTFSTLNLVDDVYPSIVADAHAMDLIICRNVLMYFAPAAVRKVVDHLRRALVEGGWLVVSPSEASHALFPHFATVNAPGVILYRKLANNEPASHAAAALTMEEHQPSVVAPDTAWFQTTPEPETLEWPGIVAVEATSGSPASTPLPTPHDRAAALFDEGRYGEAAEALVGAFGRRAPEPREFLLLVRALANQGRLDEARVWCDRWTAAEKLDPAAYYLRGVVLLEQGAADEAARSLQRALYLQPDFVVAHVASGHVARVREQPDAADRHYANALRLLDRQNRDEIVPESEGLTAGRFAEMIASLRQTSTAP